MTETKLNKKTLADLMKSLTEGTADSAAMQLYNEMGFIEALDYLMAKAVRKVV